MIANGWNPLRSQSECVIPGLRSYFHCFEDLVDDFTQFVKHYGDRYPQLPIVLMGASLGGALVVRVSQNCPQIPSALITLAPMLSLDRVSREGCNPVLAPISQVLNYIVPTWAIVTHQRNMKFPYLQDELDLDPLVYKNMTRVRPACEFLSVCKVAQQNLSKVSQLERRGSRMLQDSCSGRSRLTQNGFPDDSFVDPVGSELLIEHTSSKVKELKWINDMWHNLIQEPGNEHVLDTCVEFIKKNAGHTMG
eukprot:scaffold7462_cov430-Prasinococcus_capsulatus_cf.AAC.4